MGKRVKGRLGLHYDGYGFINVDEEDISDLFIPARYVGDAMHGDEVEAEIVKSDRDGRLEGRITAILKRVRTKIVGRLEKKGKSFEIVSEDQRVRHLFQVAHSRTMSAQSGQSVVAKITSYPGDPKGAQAEVVQILESRGTLSGEIDVVIAKHDLPLTFPDAVLEEASDVARDWQERELCERVDLSHVPLVTIDGETAKDFDDAVAVVSAPTGGLRLYVAIADVSYFVKEGSIIDKEALSRATSVYFPDRSIPMLPPLLSENLCSLKPDEARFALTAIIDFDQSGEVLQTDFVKSVIKSHARFTYKLLQSMLNGDEKLQKQYAALWPHVQRMEQLAKLLRQQRLRCGSIDFDLPESEIVLGIEEGNIEAVITSTRQFSNMLIEEFMIAANEAVARFLRDRQSGCIYRIHEVPDEQKVREFMELLKNLGIEAKITYPVKPKIMATILEKIKGRPEERMINHLLLRSMAQARYSTRNEGHFGLASRCYCHFTSPIRRYPDLAVHRQITRLLKSYNPKAYHQTMKELAHQKREQTPPKKSKKSPATTLEQIAEQSSKRERVAMEAEREMKSLFVVFFMQDKVGREFEGIISHIAKFGFFVELTDFFVEGIVRFATLEGHYKFDAIHHTLHWNGSKWRIGDKIRIKVDSVDIERRDVVFQPLQ